MKTPLRKLVRTLVLSLSMPVAGCMTAPQHQAAVRDETAGRISVGTVQREIRVGLSSADVLAALGSPNIVATDDQRREVWTYDKVATETVTSSTRLTILPLIFGGAGGAAASGSHAAGATSHRQRTLTIIIKFDAERRVRDFAYHASSF